MVGVLTQFIFNLRERGRGEVERGGGAGGGGVKGGNGKEKECGEREEAFVRSLLSVPFVFLSRERRLSTIQRVRPRILKSEA